MSKILSNPNIATGYPILRPESDDYVNTSFIAGDYQHKDIEDSEDINDDLGPVIELSYEFQLDDEDLNQLIVEGKAAYYIDLYCKDTNYGASIGISNKEIFSIPTSDISGLVEIYAFVVAVTDIADYHSRNFNEIYGNSTFDLSKGDVLAISPLPTLTAENKSTSEYLFTINKTKDDEGYSFDFEADYIQIRVGKNYHKFLDYFHTQAYNKAVFSSLIVKDAYVAAIELIIKGDEENLDRSWFTTISQKLAEMGINYKDRPKLAFEALNYYATRLINSNPRLNIEKIIYNEN